eukprot:723425_1
MEMQREEVGSQMDMYREDMDPLFVTYESTVAQQKKLIQKLEENLAAETTKEEELSLLRIVRNTEGLYSADLQRQSVTFGLAALLERDRVRGDQLELLTQLVMQNTQLRADIEGAETKETSEGRVSRFSLTTLLDRLRLRNA